MCNPDFHAVLLASGGLDSTVLAYYLRSSGTRCLPLFVNYGQHCCQNELNTLRQVLPTTMASAVKVLDLTSIYSGSTSRMVQPADLWRDRVTADDLYLPYRNLLILAAAAAFAQAQGVPRVYSAFINSNHAKEIDCSAEFFGRLQRVFDDYQGVELVMPFRDFSKAHVAKIGVDLGAPIGRTYSCQASADVPCGVCPNCVDRIEAIVALTDGEGASS